MCDVPSTAVFCSESIECLLLLLLLLLTTAVESSIGGSSPYTGTDRTDKNKYT